MTNRNKQKLAMEENRRAEQQAKMLRLKIILQGLTIISGAIGIAHTVMPYLLPLLR